MNPGQPRDLDAPRVRQLLAQARRCHFVADRIEALSRCLLGSPYKSNPLIGSASQAEVFTAALEGFDCVTYIETSLALARARSVEDFVRCLRGIRYAQSRVRWERRNHYMTQWIRNNVRDRIVKPLSLPHPSMISRERLLNAVPGLAVRRIRLKCLPKAALPLVEPHLHSGDLIFFASTRRHLDVFHAGILVRQGERMRLRNASRSQGLVVEQELAEFLKANRMSGVIVVRPQEIARGGTISSRSARRARTSVVQTRHHAEVV